MKKLTIFFLCVSLCACASIGNLESTSNVDLNKESVFVIGLSPENYHAIFFAGEVKNGKFFKGYGSAVLSTTAEKGYIVGKAEKGKTLAITTVGIKKEKTDLTATWFTPCSNSKTLVFQVPEGKVAYIGDLNYVLENGSLKTYYGQDLKKAVNHIDNTYPAFRGKLEATKSDFLPTSESCTRDVIIPVYIPRSK